MEEMNLFGVRQALLAIGSTGLILSLTRLKLRPPMSSSKPAGCVTMIASMSVKPERAAEQAAWQKRITAAVAAFPGYMGGETFEPVPGLQNEWITIHRFETGEHLREWLESEDRRRLIEEGAEFHISPPELQSIVGGGPSRQKVAVVFTHYVKEGQESAFQESHADLQTAMRRFPGMEAVETFPPVAGVQKEWVDIARFRDVQSLEAWLDSDIRKEKIGAISKYLSKLDVRKIRSGFGEWFEMSAKDHGPSRWKQGFVVLFALYPTVMLVSQVALRSGHHLPGGPALVTLVSNAISVALLNWLVMPLAIRVLGFFLRPAKPSLGVNILGVSAVLAWLLTWYFVWRAILPYLSQP